MRQGEVEGRIAAHAMSGKEDPIGVDIEPRAGITQGGQNRGMFADGVAVVGLFGPAYSGAITIKPACVAGPGAGFPATSRARPQKPAAISGVHSAGRNASNTG